MKFMKVVLLSLSAMDTLDILDTLQGSHEPQRWRSNHLEVVTAMAAMNDYMGPDPGKKLKNIIETLTTSGTPALDEAEMKKLKKFCK